MTCINCDGKFLFGRCPVCQPEKSHEAIDLVQLLNGATKMTTPKAPSDDWFTDDPLPTPEEIRRAKQLMYNHPQLQPYAIQLFRYIQQLEQSREAELEEAFRAGWDGRSDWKHPTYKHPGADDFDRAYRDYKQRKEQA